MLYSKNVAWYFSGRRTFFICKQSIYKVYDSFTVLNPPAFFGHKIIVTIKILTLHNIWWQKEPWTRIWKICAIHVVVLIQYAGVFVKINAESWKNKQRDVKYFDCYGWKQRIMYIFHLVRYCSSISC